MQQPRIAVIGAGWWATQFHIPALVEHEGSDLVALVDRDQAKLDVATERFGVERGYTDIADLVADGDVDGVLVVLPHAYHYDVAKAALEAGLHVFIEKPMTLTAAHARDLVRTAEDNDLILTVGYTYHHTSSAAKVRDAIQSKAIGDLLHVSGLFASMVESYLRGRPEDYRSVFNFPVTGPNEDTYSDPKIAGGGQGHLQVTHAMGMVLWATGARATEVAAFMDKRDLKVDLVDSIVYRLDNGAIGTMASTGSVAPGQPSQQEFRYYGTEGYILQDLVTGAVTIRYNDGRVDEVGPLPDGEAYPAHLPAQRFADMVAGREQENLAPGGAAANVVEFLEAAYRSAESGAKPVRTDQL